MRTHTHPQDYLRDLAPTAVTDEQFQRVRERYGILPGDDLETMKAKIRGNKPTLTDLQAIEDWRAELAEQQDLRHGG